MKARIWNKSGWLKFYPYGYTKLYLLSESHFAIHTFPEEKLAYYELSSCNKKYYDRFVSALSVLNTHVERE